MGEFDQWSELHPDLLNEIAKRMYSYEDYVRLRYVCKQWNLLLPKTPDHGNPWLVLPFDKTFNTHGLEEKKIYHLKLPEIQSNFFRGSCHGFLIIVMVSDGALQMLNPFTKFRFNLPPISTFPNIVDYDPSEEEYIVRNFEDGGSYRQERLYLHKIQFEKIITSSPPNCEDFMAVSIYSQDDRLAFCKLGDTRWTDIPHERIQCRFRDVIFHEGKIYAIDIGAELHEFDMKTRVPLRGFRKFVAPPRDLCPYVNLTDKYLIGCPNGGLLMVVRNLGLCRHSQTGERCCYWTYKFDIHMLKNETEQPTWSRINTLGNYAMIFGFNSSTWMLPNNFSYEKGNKIYYTDNQLVNHSLEPVGDDDDIVELAGGHDIGVLDLEDGINNRLFPNSNLLYPPPVWLLATHVP